MTDTQNQKDAEKLRDIESDLKRRGYTCVPEGDSLRCTRRSREFLIGCSRGVYAVSIVGDSRRLCQVETKRNVFKFIGGDKKKRRWLVPVAAGLAGLLAGAAVGYMIKRTPLVVRHEIPELTIQNSHQRDIYSVRTAPILQ